MKRAEMVVAGGHCVASARGSLHRIGRQVPGLRSVSVVHEARSASSEDLGGRHNYHVRRIMMEELPIAQQRVSGGGSKKRKPAGGNPTPTCIQSLCGLV